MKNKQTPNHAKIVAIMDKVAAQVQETEQAIKDVDSLLASEQTVIAMARILLTMDFLDRTTMKKNNDKTSPYLEVAYAAIQQHLLRTPPETQELKIVP